MMNKWLNAAALCAAIVIMAVFAWSAAAQQNYNQSDQNQQDQMSQTAPSSTQTGPSSTQGMSGMHHGMMHQGMHGSMNMNADTVRSVQQALQSNGQDPGPIDGHMGPKTKAALRAYQKANSLRVTGTLDEETAQKLGVSTTSSTSTQTQQ